VTTITMRRYIGPEPPSKWRNGSTGLTDIGGVAMPLAVAKELTCSLPEFLAKMAEQYPDWAEFMEWLESRP